MNRIKTLICSWLGCQPRGQYGGQTIMVKQSLSPQERDHLQQSMRQSLAEFEAMCAKIKPLPLLRRVSTDKTVSINGCRYSTPHAEVGALVQLTPLNGGWLYQVQHEPPQSTFASPDPLHSPTDIGRAGYTHTHSGNPQTSNNHDAIAAHLDEATAQAHQSNHSHHTAATVQGRASPSTCPWCGGEPQA